MSKRRNFTLIELLIVIGVIAVLTSLLLPALNASKEKARQASCKGNMKNHGLACMMYVNDYGMMPPLVFYSGGAYADGRDNPWDFLLLGYLAPDQAQASSISSLKRNNIFRCPDDTVDRGRPQSYIYNANRAPDGARDSRTPELARLASILSPASLVVEVCGNVVWKRLSAENCPIVALSSKNGIGYAMAHWSPWGSALGLYFDHSGGSNYLCVDGHVELLRNSAMAGYQQEPAGDKPSKTRWWNL